MASLALNLSLGKLSLDNFHLGILRLELLCRIFRLGTVDWHLSLGTFRLGLFAWELSLRSFRLGSLAWAPEAGGTGCWILRETPGGSLTVVL